MKTHGKKGFTLVELLVVISIIAMLLAILVPALNRARYLAKRVVCGNQTKDFLVALMTYASGQGEGKLPPGAFGRWVDTDSRNTLDMSLIMQGNGWSQTDYIWDTTYFAIKKYLKDARTMICRETITKTRESDPCWTGEPYNPSDDSGETNWRAYWLGYEYLGGHFAENWTIHEKNSAGRYTLLELNNGNTRAWKSPYRLSDSGNLAVIADKALFFSGSSVTTTFVAHSSRGPVTVSGSVDPKNLNGASSMGGNVAYLNGSVSWKPLKKMERHFKACSYGSQVTSSGTIRGYW